MNQDVAITHSGFIALLGRPNVGKSTLLNRVMGEKLVITSAKPQTTRNRINGVVNRGPCQLVFIDTPGIHESEKIINRYMTRQAMSTLSEVDACVFLVDARDGDIPADRELAERLVAADVPVILAINKTDIGPYRANAYSGWGPFHAIHEISAVRGEGVESLINDLVSLMDEGPCYYPDDMMTDRPERFIAQEFIREKVFELTGEEIPYSVAVTVESWEDKPEKELAVIHATIHVERKSQKGIIIGKGGALIRQIGQLARQDIEKLLGIRVFLDLHVGVEHNWTKDPLKLREFGYEDPK